MITLYLPSSFVSTIIFVSLFFFFSFSEFSSGAVDQSDSLLGPRRPGPGRLLQLPAQSLWPGRGAAEVSDLGIAIRKIHFPSNSLTVFICFPVLLSLPSISPTFCFSSRIFFTILNLALPQNLEQVRLVDIYLFHPPPPPPPPTWKFSL